MPPKKKVEEPKPGLSMFEQVSIFLLVLFFLYLVWMRVQDFLVYYRGENAGSIGDAIAFYYLHVFLPKFRIIAAIVSLFFFGAIAYTYRQLKALNIEDHKIYGGDIAVKEAPVEKNERWERVLSHSNSANSADWRLAIIEADVMLDDMLKAQGYHGDSLGERLKSVEKSDFLTLDNAWEAHRVRNQIAHQGGDFPLNEREAKRAIMLYESVFKEFEVI